MNPLLKIIYSICLALFLPPLLTRPAGAQETTPTAAVTPIAHILTASELLKIVNDGRRSIGHPPLELDPILMSYIQGQADLAANSIPAQGDAREAVIAMGYGYPETIDTIFCTSNSAIMDLNGTVPPVPSGFGDPGERAVNNIYYRQIGFGISKGVGDWDGYIFYQLLACYGADKRYTPGAPLPTGSVTPAAVSRVIIPVRTSSPLPNGQILHEVRSGQTLWAIAMAYQTHIDDILKLNLLPPGTDTIYQGQKLLIPTPAGGFPSPQVIKTKGAPTAPALTQTTLPTKPAAASSTPASPPTHQSGFSNEILFAGALLAGCLVFVLIKVFKR